MWVIVGIVLVTVFCVLPIGGLVLSVVAFRSVAVPAIAQAQGAAQRAQSMNNLKQIGLAFHNYHDQHGSFPPPYVADASGTPLYSWRVLILPYLEQVAAYEGFDKSASWDSPQNAVVAGTTIPQFLHPNDMTAAGTSYFMPTGIGLIAEPGKAIKLSDVTDGSSNTVLVVDAGYSIGPWAAPTDFDLSASSSYTIGDAGTIRPRDGQITVLFADGSVQSFDAATFPLQQLQSMFTRAGGEVVNRY